MNETETRKCPKCGASDFDKKGVKLPSDTVGFFNSIYLKAYICKKCGYVEFYGG